MPDVSMARLTYPMEKEGTDPQVAGVPTATRSPKDDELVHLETDEANMTFGADADGVLNIVPATRATRLHADRATMAKSGKTMERTAAGSAARTGGRRTRPRPGTQDEQREIKEWEEKAHREKKKEGEKRAKATSDGQEN